MRILLIYLLLSLLLIVSVSAGPNYHAEDFYLIYNSNEYRPTPQNPLIVNVGESLIANLTISNNGNETADDVEVNFGPSDLIISSNVLPQHIINITGLNPGAKASYLYDINGLNLNSWVYSIGGGIGSSQNEEDFSDNSKSAFVTFKDPNVDVAIFPNQFLGVNISGGLNKGDDVLVKVGVRSFLNNLNNVSVIGRLYYIEPNVGPIDFMDPELEVIPLLNKDTTEYATLRFSNITRNLAFVEITVFPQGNDPSGNYIFLNASARMSGEDVKSMIAAGAFCNANGNCDLGEDFFGCPIDCVQPSKLFGQCIKYEHIEYFNKGMDIPFVSNNQNNVIEVLDIDDTAKTADVEFNGKDITLQKGVAQELKDGENILLAELGNALVKGQNMLIVLLCANGATNKIPIVSIDLLLSANLENQPLLGEKLNVSTTVKNNGPDNLVKGASISFNFVDFDGLERNVLTKSLSSINANNKSESNYLLDLTGEERYLEVEVRDLRDPFTNNNLMRLDIFGKVPSVKKCGDGTCDFFFGENNSNCKQDCQISCGDKTCDVTAGETVLNCLADCGCGDSFCSFEFGETIDNCKQDCENAEVCGDNRCIGNENELNCPHDCKKMTVLPSVDIGEVCQSTTQCRHLGLFSCWELQQKSTCKSDIELFYHVIAGRTKQRPRLLI